MSVLWVAAAGWGLILAGCTCGEKVKGPTGKRSVAPKARKVAVKPRVPPPPVTIREPMRSLQEVTEEMRRRALGGLSMSGPVRSIRYNWKRIEWNRYPKNFKPFYDSLDAQAAALERSKDQAQDYNKLVNSCIACHHIFAQDYISIVKKLLLSKEELEEARRRATMRAKHAAKRGKRRKGE
jgi:hypothetical protein